MQRGQQSSKNNHISASLKDPRCGLSHPEGVAVINKGNVTRAGDTGDTGTLCAAGGGAKWSSRCGQWAISQEVTHGAAAFDPALSLVGVDPRGREAGLRDICLCWAQEHSSKSPRGQDGPNAHPWMTGRIHPCAGLAMECHPGSTGVVQSGRHQTQKDRRCLGPFTCDVRSRRVRRHRGQMGVWAGLGARQWEGPAPGSGVSFAVMERLWHSIEVIFKVFIEVQLALFPSPDAGAVDRVRTRWC